MNYVLGRFSRDVGKLKCGATHRCGPNNRSIGYAIYIMHDSGSRAMTWAQGRRDERDEITML